MGFGINVDAVAGVMKSPSDEVLPPDVLVFAEEGFEVKALSQVKRLTEMGFRAEFSVFEDFEESKRYAIQKGIETIYIVRDDIVEVKA